MIPGRRAKLQLDSDRLVLRLPHHVDYRQWSELRRASAGFLTPWEPTWSDDQLTRRAFMSRVNWAARCYKLETALPLFIFRRADSRLVGAITLDNIRRGPAQAGTLGYWVGAPHARHGYMREAIGVVVHHAFTVMGLSRIEAACLPENVASRGVLERAGFKYEGVAQSYLQIAGRWRTHVLYANLRHDRRGRTDAG